MTTDHSSQPDEPLRKVLREWKVTTELPPNFQEQVWRRADRAAQLNVTTLSPWKILADWVTLKLRQPAMAAVYVVLLLAVGATAGWTQARQHTSRITATLSSRYISTVDPYQKVR